MKKYTAYITPQESENGKKHSLVTNSKVETSIYSIKGYTPTILERILIRGVPRNEKKFQKLVWENFSKRPVILYEEVKSFCEKYNFTFEKLRDS